MQRKLSRKSVKSNKGQFQKSAARKRRTGVQKSISTGTNRETSSGREKISLKPRKSPVKPDNTNIRVHGGTNRAPAAKTPKQVSPQLQQLERGQRLKRLHEKGQSLAEIAGKHRYSKSLVRDLVNLASLPRDLEEAYLQGKIGRKTVVKMARARRSAVKKNPPAPIQQPQPKQNPVPVMTEEERERKISKGAALMIEWLRTTGLAPCDVEMFFSQGNSALYGGLPWLFTSEAPKPDDINPGEDPWAVIKRCRVQDNKAKLVTDIINNNVTWLARWIQRVFPDREIREAVLDLAERQRLRGVR